MKKILILFVILAAFSVSAYSQLDRSKKPQPGPAPEIQLGKYESFTLNNGLKVFVVENSKLPVVSFSLILHRDPIFEGDKSGYVSIAGELMRTGTKTKTKAQIDEAVDYLGAELNADSRGITASSLKKHTGKLLDIVSDIILNAEFKQEEFDKIKLRMISSLKAEKDQPNSIANKVKNVMMYGSDHPYGEPETEQTVNNIKLADCKSFYEKYYIPNIAYLAIVGDINIKDAKKLTEKYFSKWHKKDIGKLTYKMPVMPAVNKVAIVDRPNAVQSVVNVFYPVQLEKNSPDVIKADVANAILGGQFASRLNLSLREKHGYTYGARSILRPDEVIGYFNASTEVRNAVTDSTITVILNEMKKMDIENVAENELAIVKNYLSGNFAISLENPQTVANMAINTARFNMPKNFYANYLKNLAAVTPADIQTVSKKYFRPDNAYILAVGKADEISGRLEKFSSAGIEYYTFEGERFDPAARTLPAGVTAETVIDKYIKAIGGKDNMLKVKDRTTILSASIQTMSMEIKLCQKQPDKMYQEISMAGMKQTTVFDGTKAVANSPMGKQELTGEMLESLKMEAGMNFILDIASSGVKVQLAGTEKVNGKEAYKVEFTLPSGKKSYSLFDVLSGLKVRDDRSMTTPQGEMTQSTEYDDYRDVQGVLYPYKLTQSVAGQVVSSTVTSIEVNKGIDDSLFIIK